MDTGVEVDVDDAAAVELEAVLSRDGARTCDASDGGAGPAEGRRENAETSLDLVSVSV
jgi:hypothetical protein